LGRLDALGLCSHASKHSEVIGGPYVIDCFVTHYRTVFDRAGTIETWLRDKDVIDAPIRPRRPVVDSSVVCAYYAHTRCAMKSDYDATARKRPVNLTLNEDLVNQAKGLTDNLSQVVESLLSGYLAKTREEQLARSAAVESTVKVWNDFNAKSGSIADEYSSL
jgi:antitoxin CcdA